MPYVDGFVIPIPKKNVAAYRRMARVGAKVWMKHGALEYRECVGEDFKTQCGMPFPKLLRLKRDQTVIFAWIVYASKADRTRVNKAVMEDPAMGEVPKTMPFDLKRMVNGGFKVLVEA